MEQIKELVNDYVANEGITKEVLIKERLQMSRSAFYAKMRGLVPWELDEAIRLSALLGITVDEFARHAVKHR